MSEQDNNKKLSPGQYDEIMAKLEIEKGLMLEEALTSKDPSQILKAQQYLAAQKNKLNQGVTRAFMFDPYNVDHRGQGYKREIKKVSFEVLKRMGSLHLSKMVKNTRIDQIKNFLNFQTDDQKEGFTVRRRKGLFDERKPSNKADQKIISDIVSFLEHSKLLSEPMAKGSVKFNPDKWDIFDDLEEFISMIINDSLTYDQLAFELQRNRRFELISYKAIDASTIRLLDTIDRRYDDDNMKKYDEVFGFLPRYAQVWQSEIQRNPITNDQIVYYPWELGFAIRNKSTDIHKNYYGESELEILINITTWLLYGMEYNGNFFKNGSNPKGFINIKNGSGGQDVLNDFRETWRQLMTGPNNSHRIPVFEGIDLEWIDLQQSNKDMEFNSWIEFLMIMFCAVYTIDPSEMGWNFRQASQIFGQDGQKQRLEHSREKGLKPLLKFLQKVINKFIVSELNEEFEFIFTGVDIEDEESRIKNIDAALKAGITSFEKQFKAFEGEDYDPKKHTILNSVFQQAQQMKMYGGQESNEAVDQMTGEPDEGAQNPFDEFSRGADSNPILKESLKYIEDNLQK